jgi:hypothetical protein
VKTKKSDRAEIFLFFESRPKKRRKKRAKIFCLLKNNSNRHMHERRKGFGLFLYQKHVQKKAVEHTQQIFSTQQNGFFCQPRDDDDEHRGEEHFE